MRLALIGIIREHVANDQNNQAKVYTDDWASYHTLDTHGDDHWIVARNDGFGED